MCAEGQSGHVMISEYTECPEILCLIQRVFRLLRAIKIYTTSTALGQAVDISVNTVCQVCKATNIRFNSELRVISLK